MSAAPARVWALRLADVRRRIAEKRDAVSRNWARLGGGFGWLHWMSDSRISYADWEVWRDETAPKVDAFLASLDARVNKIAERAQEKP